MGNYALLVVAAIIMIILKVTEVITWSWWIVLAPIYVPLIWWFFIGILFLIGLAAVAAKK